jgi:HD-GYP domain-containing protein (c-di-GMP phosphodiesterase class II)
MTSNRPYRAALEPDIALAELLRERGSQWDPAVVDAFAQTLPGASIMVRQSRLAEAARPLRRSLGAVVGSRPGN